jgi:trimeric autotransporter adhesin
VAVGGSQQLTATGTFSDGTTLDITVYVGWSSSDASVADVSNAAGTKGLAYGFKAGSVTVTATRGIVKGTAALGVK